MARQRVVRPAALALAVAAITAAAIIIAFRAVTTEETAGSEASAPPARLERTYGPVVISGARLDAGRRGDLTFCYRIRVKGHPSGSTCASRFFADRVSSLVYAARGRGTFVGGVVGDLVDDVYLITRRGETVAARLRNRAFLVRLPRGSVAAELVWVLDDGTQRSHRIAGRKK